MPNRLARESSPYLLQHAGNPVDWYPWGEEAFGVARATERPIFLSIGYSTCHWCHVMEHESFEDAAVAAVLNEHFVPVKVDREERPDVDRVYMLFVQATTGAGGWPMSVWLTPDLQPFYGGTYFPPTSRWGRPGFTEVLREVARAWREDRRRVLASAASLTDRLQAATAPDRGAERGLAAADELVHAAEEYRRAADPRHGGFGGAPKFPRPSELLFLLRHHARRPDADLVGLVHHALQGMALGGMRDQLGGGFHRYSVDAQWRVPHFEKMLYDQAQLVLALLEAGQAGTQDYWLSIAEDTLEYVQRDLMHPDGGFYSAEDADSVPPEAASLPGARRTEGAFYLWSTEELDRHLGADSQIFKLRFGCEPGGNAPSDPQDEFGSGNILYTARSLDDITRETGRAEDDLLAALARARTTLLGVRASRPRPPLDDKVLTSWNGLMIGAFARAARVLDNGSYDPSGGASAACLATAARAARFLRERSWDAERGVLLRRWRAGDAAIEGYAEDYAFLILGLLDLFQSSGDVTWLEWAIDLQARQDALFWDEEEGGWFSTTGHDRSVLLRMKEEYDGAEPSAGSVSVLNLLTLGHLVSRDEWAARVERTLGRIGPRARRMARAMPLMLAALEQWHAGTSQVVIVGDPALDATRALRQVVARRYLPFAVVVPVAPGEAQARLARVLPWVDAMNARDGRPTAYVCRNFTCESPVTTPEALDALLSGGRS